MPSIETRQQIERLQFPSERPLIICDVDEVIVHFIKGLESFLAKHDLWLDPASFALNGNIKTITDNIPVEGDRVGSLLAAFFSEETIKLQPIDGSIVALQSLAQNTDIVLLSNVPHEAYNDRQENLKGHGLDFPLVSNRGPKGPAARLLTEKHQAPVFFIDDIGHYLSSVNDYCPDVHLVHFLQDGPFSKHAKVLTFDHYRTNNWTDVEAHIRLKLSKTPS